jgi:ABC-type transporter Mla subunit MlaD
MYTKNAELKAGLVVVAAIAALLFLLFRATGSRLPWADVREIWLRFEQGYAAPVKDDPVYMNGFEVGRVMRVWQAEEIRKDAQLTDRDRARLKLQPDEPGTAREIYVLAAVALEEGVKIPGGTTAEISVTLTGARVLSLLPGLEPTNISDEDTRKRPIPATSAGDLADVQRSVQALLERVTGVVGNLDLVLADVRDVVGSVKRKVDSIDVTGIQGNVLEASKTLRDTLASLQGKLDEIANRVSEAAANAVTITSDGSALVKGARQDVAEVLANIKDLSVSLKETVARLAPKIETTLEDVAAAARTANATIAEFKGLGAKVQGLVGDVGTDLDVILKRVAEAGHNLADMTEDLRSHPWKLANRPEDKEIAFENVRNAASNYVRASQSIQESLAEIRALEGRADLAQDDRKRLLTALTTRLQGDLARYEEAAKVFSQLLRSSQVQAPR